MIFNDEEEMADFLVAKWKEIAEEAIAAKGLFTAALSGGKTPVVFYRRLAGIRESFPWRKTHIFLADERLVPFGHKESNYGMISNLLLKAVGIPHDNCHPIPVNEPSPDISAKKYGEELRTFFAIKQGELPELDLILLGIGQDGHTASLFAGSPALRNSKSLAAGVILDERGYARVTLTLPVLNNAKHVIFLASGKEKARIVKEVVEERDPSLPSSLVRPIKGELLFILDAEAGSLLSKERTE